MIEAKLIPNEPTYHLIDKDGNDLEVPIYIGKTKNFDIPKKGRNK